MMLRAYVPSLSPPDASDERPTIRIAENDRCTYCGKYLFPKDTTLRVRNKNFFTVLTTAKPIYGAAWPCTAKRLYCLT